jgi:hypothetical protein
VRHERAAAAEAIRKRRTHLEAHQAEYQRQKRMAEAIDLPLPVPPMKSWDGSDSSDDEPLIRYILGLPEPIPTVVRRERADGSLEGREVVSFLVFFPLFFFRSKIDVRYSHIYFMAMIHARPRLNLTLIMRVLVTFGIFAIFWVYAVRLKSLEGSFPSVRNPSTEPGVKIELRFEGRVTQVS